MVINKIVYKEGIKTVQGIMMRKILGYPCGTIDRQQMSSMSNCLEWNNLGSWFSLPVAL